MRVESDQVIELRAIGRVRCTRREMIDDDWDRESSSIELDAAQFGADALLGLEAFSHVEIVYYLHGVDPARIESSARHPRNNPAWPRVGIFAQRAKNRPNRIGTTVCRVLGVDGRTLRLADLDAIDGTPVLDIKPWLGGFAPRGAVREPAWSLELMSHYWRRD